MRELLRAKARAAMKRRGVQHMNKPKYGVNPKAGMLMRFPSYFAQHWREYAGKIL